MISPAFCQLANDPLLGHGSVAPVYLRLIRRLDYVEFRTVKATAVAHWLGRERHAVDKALRALCEAGYLDRKRDGRMWVYRLFWSRSSEEFS